MKSSRPKTTDLERIKDKSLNFKSKSGLSPFEKASVLLGIPFSLGSGFTKELRLSHIFLLSQRLKPKT